MKRRRRRCRSASSGAALQAEARAKIRQQGRQPAPAALLPLGREADQRLAADGQPRRCRRQGLAEDIGQLQRS
jgi:hypothetical protein